MGYHYDPEQALEELSEDVVLPNPVHVRDMIFRARLTANVQVRNVYHEQQAVHQTNENTGVNAAALGTEQQQEDLAAAQRAGTAEKKVVAPIVNTAPQVGRNDPCPCGSGKKYKKCCGANAA